MTNPKQKFGIGERVLCFEPDQTKARVLYDAKILDVDFVRGGKAKKEAEYKVHFQGWNHTWDRWANENYVLKDTEENRQLQKKLAKLAIKKLKSRGRKKVHLPGVAKVIKKCSAPLSDVSSDSEGSEAAECLQTCDDESTSSHKRRRKKSTTSVSKQSDELPPNVETSNPDDIAPSYATQRRCPPLDIPSVLVKRLQEDNLLIKKRNKLVDLPAKLNIVQILENYAKHFALHVAKLPSSEKMMKSGTQSTDLIPPEKNLSLCKETCQELRVLIDFILPVVLLYDPEQEQYTDVINRTRIYNPLHHLDGYPPPTSPSFTFSPPRCYDDDDGDDAIISAETKKNELSGPMRKRSNTQRQMKLSPHHRKTAEQQIIEETHTYIIPHQPNLDRTGLASDAQGRRRSSRLSHHLLTPGEDASESSSTRSNEGSNPVKVTDTVISMDTLVFLRAPNNHTHGVKNERDVKSPLPLLCREDDRYSCFSSSISLNQMCQEVFVGSAGDDVKKAVHLSQTWKFRLFPYDYRPSGGASVPASLIYGVHHLIRLFVKLPEIFSKMDFPDFKLKIIYKHLQTLLKFLADYEAEIFSLSSSYVGASANT